MKPEFIHNPKNLTYEDALDCKYNDWVEPEPCPVCGDDPDYCTCSYGPRPQLPEYGSKEWDDRLKSVMDRIYHRSGGG